MPGRAMAGVCVREERLRELQDGWIADRIARVEDAVLRALAAGETPTPAALSFLVRRYAVSDRADIGDRLGRALAIALDEHRAAPTTTDRAAWLLLFVDARHVSDDERIQPAMADLADRLAAEWTHTEDRRAAASIEACLRAWSSLDSAALVPHAIDELERLVAVVYRPGDGARDVGEHIGLASTLLTAFGVTGRLPYAMLAEELVQGVRRQAWNPELGRFEAPFDLNCAAARVLARLSALHGEPEYVAAAVLAPDADYDRDAADLLVALNKDLPEGGVANAPYGLALVDFVSR